MRSGNGRHRRPRQVPAIVVTAGVTGSALALPLLAATGASAADTSTWDKVAECESGGSWSANSGSGSYGGLSFTQEQWNSSGGLDFAERPDLASRSQQIAVAERVLGTQGPQAWGQCSESAGLTRQAPAASVDPGLPGTLGPVAASPSRPDHLVPAGGTGAKAHDFGAPTPAPAPAPDFTLPPAPLAPNSGLPVMPDPDVPSTSPTVPVLPGDPTANPGTPTAPTDPTAPTAPGSPTKPGGPADPTAPVVPADPGTPAAPGAPGASTDPSAIPDPTGTGKHRGTPALELPAASEGASAPSYTVQAGDSLATIASAKGVKGGWNALYQANEQVIGEDADLIKPGQNLDLS
ncbi:transglycosylase family protein [Streptomyces sp. A1547]|uniref:LysM peptidoglycan-binding domain-containing protein n=1 Tax=Streptomyces sp. A1547 TaxID=2563105 RepID=UPI00109E7A99|nr:transglycosylase family protein [Streptomyces sp. A1547]THA34176.1 LysM peptidoglycan-binding domain-containing protein [Streptomyces sp. A1547]